ncbi:hypothetical protein Q2941_33510 [Bradyrhizobium sp. UFLA05-153]
MTLRCELEPFAARGRKAFSITRSLFDAIVATLRRDQRFLGIKSDDLDLLLADLRRETEQRLFNEMRDRVHLDDVEIVDGEYP